MFRTLFVCCTLVPVTIIMGGIGAPLFLVDRSGWIFRAFAVTYCRICLLVAGVRLHASGLENLTLGTSYVFVANHQSLFDIPSAFVGLPFKLVMTPKRELFRIPIFGWALYAAGFIPIDRRRPEEARQRLKKGAARFKGSRTSVLLFPEGTRSEDGEVHNFKKGAFYLARDLGVPIVPVSIVGTDRIVAKHSLRFRPGRVSLLVGKPIELSERRPDERAVVMEELREHVVAGVERLRADPDAAQAG